MTDRELYLRGFLAGVVVGFMFTAPLFTFLLYLLDK